MISSLIPLLFGCTELMDGATRQVFVDAALELDHVPEGEARDQVLAMTDAGWLSADEVGIARATRFASELDRKVVDDALSADEVAALAALAEGFGVARVGSRKAELMAKRQAEHETRRIRTARIGIKLDGADVWPAPGALVERGEEVGFTPHDCHRQRESGYQVETCRFLDGDEFVELTFTVFAERADARLAAHPAPWERGATAFRRGRKVLKVRSTDQAEAVRTVEATAHALAERETESPIALTAFQTALIDLGYRVDACREDRTGELVRLSCDVRDSRRGGFVVLEHRPGHAVATGDALDLSPTYASSEAQLDLGGLLVRGRIHTEEASSDRLARFRGSTPAGAEP